MYDMSVIISTNDENIVLCLHSVLNQTLKNIEIICIYNDYNYHILKKYSNTNKRIKLVPKNSQLNNKINGEYVLIINDVIQSKICELIFNYSKSKDLDLLLIPKYDFLIKEKYENQFPKDSNLIFTKFYKKVFFKSTDVDLISKCKKVEFFNKNLYSQNTLNMNFLESNLKNIINHTNKIEINIAFSALIDYLDNFPINTRQSIYSLIKNNFKQDILNNKNQMIFKIIYKNKYYLDFLSEYKLSSIEYNTYYGALSENQNYKISIIIPIFNNEKLIHRTLMSIENQSIGLENIEILMINDGSTDNTPNIINNYADNYFNFKAIHIKKRTGSAGTPRNLGLKLASAEYILFMDHDDFFEINALEKLYNKTLENKCDIVYGTYVLIDGNNPIKFIYPNEKQGYFKNLEENIKSITIPPSIWTKLFKKDFLLKNNILFPTILGEDIIFMSKAFKNANGIYYLWEDIIYYYNLNENSLTKKLPYKYFVEGFTSEKYLFQLYSSWNNEYYYNIRGQGILDFYINQFMHSNLDENEIKKIFPLFYEFCNRLYSLKIFPKQNRNKKVFNYVIKKDVNSLIKFKNYKPNKFRIIANKIQKKISKYVFW